MVKRYFIILGIFTVVFLFNISATLASNPSEDAFSASNSSYTLSISSGESQVMKFDELYSVIVSNSNLENSMIELDGNIHGMIELPTTSIAVKLPDDRVVIKYSDEDTSILPKGSTVSNYEDGFVVSIPTQDTVLKVSKVVELPITNFAATATFDQSINDLNKYKVNIVFNELDNPVLHENIQRYSVDWGDGNVESYNIDEKIATHIYRKSGTYDLTLNVTDDFGFTHSIKQDYNIKYEGHLVHGYLWVKENKEPVAVTTSTSISALAVGFFALTETGKYKLLALLPLLIHMYTRIQKEDVLDQFVRGQIYGYIRTNPGVHYNQIRRGIDVKNGTLSYHLSVLEKTELVKSRREGLRYRAFYPTGMKFQ
jgi:DNA-binding transcriptional ArsR family regulator